LPTDLEKKLTMMSTNLELAKQENRGLKNELTLFKKSENIDSRRFVDASDAFLAALDSEIALKDVSARMIDRGFVVTITADKLFISGTDILSNSGAKLLDKISSVIEEKFADNYIYIEGHTDNQSLAVFEWKSDWDFSFARALCVLKYFSDKKHINPLQLSAAGFGRYRPLSLNSMKEGRRLNRRVEVIISPQRVGYVLSQRSEP